MSAKQEADAPAASPQEAQELALATLAAAAGGAQAGLSLLSMAGQPGGLAKPFSKQILLVESYVAGTSHVQGIGEIAESLQPGCRFDLQRDPENLHDCWAIKVFAPGGARIGFVPVSCNQILARLMDGGKCLYGLFTGMELNGSWYKLYMEVYLDD